MARQAGKNNSRRTRKARLTTASKYLLNVAGVSFSNEDGSDRQTIISRCRPGECLLLIREPDNKFDPAAIKVTRLSGQQLGYIPSQVTGGGNSNGLAGKIDTGTKYRCRIADIIGGELGILYGVQIEIKDCA